MTLRERRQKHKVLFRQEILDAARELFSQIGYERFSMRKLAAKIEHSPTTIYLYFRDKDDLLYSLCEELFAKLFQSYQQISKGHSNPMQVLRLCLLKYIEFGLANPGHYKVAFFTSPVVYGSPTEFLQKDSMGRRTYFHILRTVEEAMAADALRAMDADLLAQTLWTAVHGVVASRIYTADFPMVDATLQAETLVDGLLAGFCK